MLVADPTADSVVLSHALLPLFHTQYGSRAPTQVLEDRELKAHDQLIIHFMYLNNPTNKICRHTKNCSN